MPSMPNSSSMNQMALVVEKSAEIDSLAFRTAAPSGAEIMRQAQMRTDAK